MKLFLLLLLLTVQANAKNQLTLDYKAEVQVRVGDVEGDTWNTVEEINGPIGGGQFWLKRDLVFRLKITARKPHDIKGTFKVRTPTRTDGVVAPEGTGEVVMIFGPHKGCPEQEERCRKLSLNDIGNVELMLKLERADQVSLGIFLLRPYDEELELAYRPALTYKNKSILCGDTVKKGFWIFARRFYGSASPLDTISLCVKNPKGKVKCVEDSEDDEIKIKARRAGTYEFTTWNRGPISSTCYIKAE